MKRIFFLTLLVLAGSSVFSQTADKAPYQKFKSIPPFDLLLPDSVTHYRKADLPKNKAVLIVLFSPMCEHCQHETEDITKNIDQFKNVQILMVTSLPFDSMIVFREKYHLERYDNIVVAHDPQFLLIPYFQISQMPFLAFYNRKKEFISVHEGNMPLEKLVEEIKK
jgi:thioredoxin-related protein